MPTASQWWTPSWTSGSATVPASTQGLHVSPLLVEALGVLCSIQFLLSAARNVLHKSPLPNTFNFKHDCTVLMHTRRQSRHRHGAQVYAWKPNDDFKMHVFSSDLLDKQSYALWRKEPECSLVCHSCCCNLYNSSAHLQNSQRSISCVSSHCQSLHRAALLHLPQIVSGEMVHVHPCAA